MENFNKKEEFARAVSLFLAELIRSREITLERAAEIAQKVVENINLIDSEEHFLRFSKELSADFEELFHLHERIRFDIKVNERRHLEQKVRDFVVDMLVQNPKLAYEILQ